LQELQVRLQGRKSQQRPAKETKIVYAEYMLMVMLVSNPDDVVAAPRHQNEADKGGDHHLLLLIYI
jgi:hypothetical protein